MALTKRQFDVLQALDTLCAKGHSPSREELGASLGVSSLATVHKHITNLKRKGLVQWEYNRARSIELTKAGKKALEKRAPKHCPKCGEVLVA